MLSISKLTAGQGRYYLEGAGERVDVVESVGDGLEEYYLGGTEAPGEWLGAGAAQLGLTGAVEGDALRRALAGENAAGVALRASRVPVKVAGFDLTFSAPKSVSVLFGLGDRHEREAVRRAHDRAAREAIAYVERTAAAVRRGAGGARVEPAGGLVVATFRHRTSRAGDPQLHTHCLVVNLAQGPDERWSTLDGRRIYTQARAASFVYQAVLRSELSRELDVRWLSVHDGIAEIAGVPEPVRDAFSRRRAEIQAELDRRGTSGPRASETAALTTRQPKDRRTSAEELAVQWRFRGAELGFGRDQLTRLISHKAPSRRFDAPQLDRIFARLAAPSGLTREHSTFSRRDVVQGLAEALPAELEVTAGTLEHLADRFLSSDRVVPMVPNDADAEMRLSFRRRDGRLLPLAREEWIYSTPELLGLEQRLISTAVTGQGGGAALAEQGTVAAAIATRPTLGADQRAMLETLCLRGDRIAVVVGKAGTGKTYALAAAREAWHATGRPVLGVSVARRTANQLQADAGIASTSVAALLADLDRHGRELPAGAVLVVDEAGMIGTRQLARLVDAVEHADGKLVLVGDHRQLPELEAGGTFRALVRRGLAVQLTENRRQREPWERTALDQLRDGSPSAAIEAYVAHERVRIARTLEQCREQIVDEWHAASGEKIMIAQRRSDVADLNARARTRLSLGPEDLVIGDAPFAVGDQVVVRRNDFRLGVTNGERGEVVAIDKAKHRLRVRLASGLVTLDRNFLGTRTPQGDAPLAHGYAITCHIAQGVTVDRAFVLADSALTNELGYTALSRGRLSNHLYLAEELDTPSSEYAPVPPLERDAIGRLVDSLSISRGNVLAIDAGQPDPEEQLAAARDELRRADVERTELEARRWSPWRRDKLGAARERSAAAGERVARLEAVAAEQRHAELPHVDERAHARRSDRLQNRIIERSLERDRSRGIEL